MNFVVDQQNLRCELELLQSNEFTVQSVPRPYKVSWDMNANSCDTINAVLAKNSNNLLFIDEKVFQLYGQNIHHPEDKIFKAPATEQFKTLDGVTQLFDFLHSKQFTKAETLVVVGGGIIQDVAAFAGACYKRGIKWVHFPSTLLSMCDSCIGGKTGINYKETKNQLALFSAPHAVIINPNFLATLHKDDIKSGLGEILKLFITGGEPLLSHYYELVKNGEVVDPKQFKTLIFGALLAKKAVVEADEFELNLRKVLNYGHTLGHAIESLSQFQIPHGIAVVIGMILVNEMSCALELLSYPDKEELNRLCMDLLEDRVLRILQTIDVNKILELIKHDKKTLGNEINFVLLKAPGDSAFVRLSIDQNLLTSIKAAFAEVVAA